VGKPASGPLARKGSNPFPGATWAMSIAPPPKENARYQNVLRIEKNYMILRFDETMDAIADQEVNEISQKIMKEVEHAKSRELADSDEMIKILHLTNTRNAKALLEHAEEAPTKRERDIGKKAVVKALLVSTWHTRLYFIIRSFIMGLLSASLTLLFVLIFHSITLALEIPLGIFSFIFSLAVSRLLDVQIVKATKTITDYLSNHQSLRNFILNHF
jgi:hypothetical protein